MWWHLAVILLISPCSALQVGKALHHLAGTLRTTCLSLFEASARDGVSLEWRAACAALHRVSPPSDGDGCSIEARDTCDATATGRIVLVRHGESTWNCKNRFTGWHDVPLSSDGERQAVKAARALQASSICFDAVYTSQLKRTIKTAWIVLEQLDEFTVPVVQSWRLNERMYGALTGLDKAETRRVLGEAAFEELRRMPPPIGPDSCYDPRQLSLFSSVPADQMPEGESFEQTRDRVLPYWHDELLPRAQSGETVLVVSSKNCLRALLMGIAEHVPTEDLIELDIPNCVPLVFTPETGAITQLQTLPDADQAAGAASAATWAALAQGSSSSSEMRP